MNWIFLAASGQLLNAVVAIIDKYLVTDEKALPRPFVYAFYSCLITGFWILIYLVSFIPGLSSIGVPDIANVKQPTIEVVSMSFLAAYTFFMALVSMFESLKREDASDVMPVIGSVAAICSFLMGYLFLGSRLTENFVWGIALLSLGTMLVSQLRFAPSVALQTVHSGIFFALHGITMKGLFISTSFDDGFFWSRVAFVLFALSLLLVPTYFRKINAQTKNTTKKTGMLVLFNKVIAGVAAFMLLKATDLGEVEVVQALDALKFVFILFLSIVCGRFIPTSAGENSNDFATILRKVLYVSIIAIGFVILFT